jgi:Asp-tRNA(Asn)/Glu-tRNA(Gln) amidotransferase A subunit family amidase
VGRSTDGELAFLTIEEAAPRLASGDRSPEELTTAVLERVGGAELLEATYIDLLAESALAEAKIAEADIAAFCTVFRWELRRCSR